MNINVNHEYDMLRGNVNRMCVCDTQEELERRKESAIKNIENIYLVRKEMLEKRKQYLRKIIKHYR